MLLKDKTKEVPALMYVAESMSLLSAAGRRRMIEQSWMTDPHAIAGEQDHVASMRRVLQQSHLAQSVTLLRHQLMQLHDIRSTIEHLQHHFMLDEVELFEVKQLAYLCARARKAIEAMALERSFPLPDLQPLFALLDPDATGVPNFYVYDSYDPRLAPLRQQMRQADDRQMAELLAQQEEIQQQVIATLCDRLYPHAGLLGNALEQMAYIDFTQARAALAIDWGLQSATPSTTLHLHGLFDPRLREHNRTKGLRYQPVDIDLTEGVTLITGANMAGKTVLLKSVGLAQLMYQFGLPLPADSATLAPVDDVVYCIGDEQDEMKGLSSYASEITHISHIIHRSRNERLLVLIDEPARTTNPIEGKALVQAIATLQQQRESITLITTHYSQLHIPVRRLRVHGFVERMAEGAVTADNINRYIDYSLVADSGDEVPHEALRIAEILECDKELLAEAHRFTEQEK